jgi:DNA-binding transcriptional LysR family regulator
MKIIPIGQYIQNEVTEDQAIISMVQNSIGISILPSMILYRLPENVRAIPLESDHYCSIGITATSFKHVRAGLKNLSILFKTGFKNKKRIAQNS